MPCIKFFVQAILTLLVISTPLVDSSQLAGKTDRTRKDVNELRRTHRVNQVLLDSKPQLHVKDRLRWAHQLAKHNIAHAATKQNRYRSLQTGSVENYPEVYDIQYFCRIKVGNVELVVAIDTGSPTAWVFSELIPMEQYARNNKSFPHTLYNLTGTTSDKLLSFGYLDGSHVVGKVYTDKMTIGDVSVDHQKFVAAYQVDELLIQSTADGLIGMNYNYPIEGLALPTFMQTLHGSLPQNLFTLTLRRGAPGHYDFGFIDEDEYEGTIGWTPVRTDLQPIKQWTILPRGFSIGDSEEKPWQFAPTIIDTGTSFTIVSREIEQQYWSGVLGAQKTDGAWEYPCEHSLPDFSIYLSDGHKATAPGHHFSFADLGDGVCQGSLVHDEDLHGILGDSFLKSQFVVLDYGEDLKNPHVGLARQKGI